MDLSNDIKKALIDIKTKLSNSLDNIEAFQIEHRVYLMGSKKTIISSVELNAILKREYNIIIGHKELLEYIDIICPTIDMEIARYHKIDSHNNFLDSRYDISLL